MAEENATATNSEPLPGELTVDAAATVLEGLFSDEDKEPSRETRPARKPAPRREQEAPREEEEAEPEKGEESDPDEQSDPEPESTQTDEEPDEDSEQPQLHTVKIDGRDEAVTLDELIKGYSRQGDYTRKTQELAKQRQTQEADFSAVRAERQKYAAALGDIEAALRSGAPAEPDWDRLAIEHPEQLATTWAQWNIHKKNLEAVAAEKARADSKVAEDLRRQHVEQMTQQRDLLFEALPEWKEPKARDAQKGKLLGYLNKMGFTEDDMKGVTDHRVLVLAHKARMWDEAQNKLPAVRQRIQTVKTATPGAATSMKTRKTTDATKAKQRLAKTGSVTDAARAIEFLLDD